MGIRSISFKFITTVIVITVVIQALISFAVYRSNSHTLLEKHVEMANKVSEQISETVNNWISVQFNAAKAVADNKLVIEVLKDPYNEEKRTAASEYLETIKNNYPYCENVAAHCTHS